MAADSGNGHIFVADSENNRIVEFNALGQFIKAWGWGVDTGAAEAQTCTEASRCGAGLEGSSTGQFGFFGPQGVAVDSAGNVYVVDRGLPSNARVQKFDRAGDFVLMFGGEVNKTKVDSGIASEEEENVCPFSPGDQCKSGTEGTGQGQFGEWPVVGDYIAIYDNGTPTDADDIVYVGDVNRVQVFDTDGNYQSEFAVSGPVQGLATDADGNLYAILDGDIHKLSPLGVPLSPETFEIPSKSQFESAAATAVAVDSDSNVFAFGPTSVSGGQLVDPIIEFDQTGAVIAEFGKGEFSGSTGFATNLCSESQAPGNLYVTNASSSEAFLRAYGTEPIGCFKARTLAAEPIGETDATLNGTVNPKGEAVTECFFEYGTTTAYGQVAQCDDPDAAEIGMGGAPVAVHADISGLEKGAIYHFRLVAKVGGETEPGADEEFKTRGPPVISEERTATVTDTEATLKALVNPEGFATTCQFEYGTSASYGEITPVQELGDDRTDHPAIANLKGLAPGTTYHWQILCSNESGNDAGEDRAFTTFLPFVANGDCPNQVFRVDASAFLSDCRAYEMVSPADKNGGDILSEKSGDDNPGGYVQISTDGERITYTAIAAFADTPSTFRFNQYLASRQERGEVEEGWSNQGIRPPVTGQKVEDDPDLFGLFREFMAFSPDLCSAWLVDHQTPPPTPDGQEDYRNLYRRDNCGEGAGTFEPLIPDPPYGLPVGTSPEYVDAKSVQGHSDDSMHAIFAARAKLIPEAANGGSAQLYDRFGGALHLVSVLPGGSAASGDSSVGSGYGFNLDNAVSVDGSVVYWTNSGLLYVRRHPDQGIVTTECDETTTACTLAMSSSTAFFWAASSDGSKALYSEGDDLYQFDLQKAENKELEPSSLIAANVQGVAGTSEDLSRVYFVSSAALPEAGPNTEEQEAVAGQPNLYLAEGGQFSFVATLAAGDVGAVEAGATVTAYNVISRGSNRRATRVSSDGSRLAFQSRAPLTGYDNTAPDGRASVEVFLYEAGGDLMCVSCNPSGARPNGVREMEEPYVRPQDPQGRPTKVPAAAWIPTWEHPLHASNVLSADGGRLFFNSNDALLLRDTNGTQDVYEWEAPGMGGCDLKDADYFPQNGGCLYLISSGESPFESEFWEASSDGRDVFFTTESALLPQDPGSIDLYDARVGGGFPQPVVKEPCEGEACQSPPPPPAFTTPSSSTYSGPGNPPPASKPRCPKGKRKVRKAGKTRCVKKQAKKHGKGRQRGANHKRRAQR